MSCIKRFECTVFLNLIAVWNVPRGGGLQKREDVKSEVDLGAKSIIRDNVIEEDNDKIHSREAINCVII